MHVPEHVRTKEVATDTNHVCAGIFVHDRRARFADCVDVIHLDGVVIQVTDARAVEEKIVVVGFNPAECCAGTNELVGNAEAKRVEIKRC